MRPIAFALFVLAGTVALGAEGSLDAQKRREAEQAYRRARRRCGWSRSSRRSLTSAPPIKLDPLLSIAHYSLGQALMALKRYPDAVEAYLGCRESFERIASLSTQDKNAIEKAREDEIRELNESILRVQQGKVKGGSTLNSGRHQERLRVLEGSRMKGHEERVGVPGGGDARAGERLLPERPDGGGGAGLPRSDQTDSKLGSAPTTTWP